MRYIIKIGNACLDHFLNVEVKRGKGRARAPFVSREVLFFALSEMRLNFYVGFVFV